MLHGLSVHKTPDNAGPSVHKTPGPSVHKAPDYAGPSEQPEYKCTWVTALLFQSRFSFPLLLLVLQWYLSKCVNSTEMDLFPPLFNSLGPIADISVMRLSAS